MKPLFFAAIGAALCASPAFAQTQTDATGQALSGSQAFVNQNTYAQRNQSLKTVPSVNPPGIYGGTNVCAVGASGGVSVLGVGVSAGREWSDEGCEKRSEAVVLFQMGAHAQAIDLMCQFADVEKAMDAAGTPCPSPSIPQAQNAALPATPTSKPAPTCVQAFVAPTNPDGAGHMETRCF